jgi:Flp pilus assembly protein TadB
MDTAKKEMAKEQSAADAVKTKARSKMSREAHKAEAVTVRKEKKAEKKATQKADAMKTKDSVNKSVAAFRAKGYKGHLKSSAKGLYNVGAAGAESIRENADWFYGVLYAIALSLVICIITIPSIAFFIVGIICYFLLKNNMKSIKGF